MKLNLSSEYGTNGPNKLFWIILWDGSIPETPQLLTHLFLKCWSGDVGLFEEGTSAFATETEAIEAAIVHLAEEKAYIDEKIAELGKRFHQQH